MAADEPRHEPAESIRPQDTPGEKREAAPRMPAIVAEVDPSPTNPTKPDQEGKPPSWTFKDWLEVIAVLTAIGLLIVNICQSRSNEKAAVATQKSVEHADRNFRIDERAWIELEHIETQRLQAPPSWHGGGLLVLRVSLKNYGKTSGRNLVIKTNTRGIVEGKATESNIKEFLEHLLPERAPSVLAPGISTDTVKFGGLVQLPHKSFGLLQTTDYVGRIEYDDVFGLHHWSTFCYELLASGQFLPCEYGNDEDQDVETHKP